VNLREACLLPVRDVPLTASQRADRSALARLTYLHGETAPVVVAARSRFWENRILAIAGIYLSADGMRRVAVELRRMVGETG
jgi:hypothetical protein